MIVELPDTNTTDVSKQLVKLRKDGGAVTVGRVLTLLVSVEKGEPGEAAIEAAISASHEHPCRVIVVDRGEDFGADGSVSRIDAQIRIGGDAGASEVVVLRLSGPVAQQAASCIIPFLLPDTPVVAWWPGTAPDDLAADPIGRLATRRITDAGHHPNPAAALAIRSANYTGGDSDLSWARITPWRALLASALDQPPHEAVTGATVAGPEGSPDADLIAGWLRARMQVPVIRHYGSFEVTLRQPSGDFTLALDCDTTALLTRPGKPVGRVAIGHRDVRDCLAEELRRLDADEPYENALRALTELEVA